MRKLVTAAGGNATAVEVIREPLSRADYAARGKDLCDDFAAQGAEQAGFFVLSDGHFEMAGGEFCGNATRSAAVLLHQKLLHQEHGQGEVSLTVSGFGGTVTASVTPLSETGFFVAAAFPGMQVDVREVLLEDGSPASLVDLGGTVHVAIEGEFPSNPAEYRARHSRVVEHLKLAQRDAVGVLWFSRSERGVAMHPVVWVRAVDTFYYETSCGSGTLALGRVTGAASIVQPSGQSIWVEFERNRVVLSSEMEVID